MRPSKISHVVMMGDSLSDRGTMAHRRLLGVVPMNQLSGLKGESPDGRFTNGFAWSDYVSAMIANQFIINDIEDTRDIDATDIADGLIDGDLTIVPLIDKSYTLNQDRVIDFKGKNLVRNYDEGGLTAYDYSWRFSKSISRFFSRIILPSLSDMREKLLADDISHELSKQHKAETLVVEWSGANDLITVNERPSQVEVSKAISARVENIKELIKKGYKHFVVFNLPDLALTPRFQARDKASRDNAHSCCKSFNEELVKACKELSTVYTHCSFEVFDVNHIFGEIYTNPEPHFSREKLSKPYIRSTDFEIRPDGTSPAKGYMFWDDVHPTADVHAQLAEHFYTMLKLKYNLTEPVVDSVKSQQMNITEDELLASFRKLYGETLRKEQNGFFGAFQRSNIAYRTASLDDILVHALLNDGWRTLRVMKELQWFDSRNNLNLNIPVLKQALGRVDAMHLGSPISPLRIG